MTIEPPDPSKDIVDDGPTRSVARNIGALMSSQVVTWVLATVLVWIVPRFLGAEAFGQLTLANSIWAIAIVFAGFGTSTMLTVEVAKQRTAARSLVRNTIRLRLVLFALAAPIVAILMILGPYDRPTREVVLVVGIGASLMLVSFAYESGLHGLQEMGRTARIQVIMKVALTIGTVTALLAGGRLLVVAGVSVASVALGTLLFNRGFSTVAAQLRAPTGLSGRTLMIAAAPFLLAGATRVVYQQIDTVVMSLLVDERAIGYYAAADTLFGSLLFVPVIVTTALFPAIADLHQRAPHDVPALLSRAFSTMLLVAVPIGLGTVLVAPTFIDLLFGEDFEESAAVLAIFGVVVILSSQTILLGRFALATDRVKFWSLLMVAVTVLSIPLDIVLVPWAERTYDNAAIGGALAYVVTEAILILVGMWTIGRQSLNRSTIGRVLRCCVAGTAMLAAGWPFRDDFFIVPGLIGTATYCVVILALRTLNQEEASMARRATSTLSQGRR